MRDRKKKISKSSLNCSKMCEQCVSAQSWTQPKQIIKSSINSQIQFFQAGILFFLHFGFGWLLSDLISENILLTGNQWVRCICLLWTRHIWVHFFRIRESKTPLGTCLTSSNTLSCSVFWLYSVHKLKRFFFEVKWFVLFHGILLSLLLYRISCSKYIVCIISVAELFTQWKKKPPIKKSQAKIPHGKREKD